MRRVIRKRIRRKEDGLDLAIDFNADIAINTGGSRPAPAHDAPAGEADRPPEQPAPDHGPDERKEP
jgi:hypothetical protein